MKAFVRKIRRFLVAEDGPTAVEYVIMLSLIVLVCLAAIDAIGTRTNTSFNNMAKSLGAS